ncbi:hypothetical protein [Paenibacillus taiwanensis]|uniref:hypothetical protein n=1 Tax=Paenibacillus taiwanensis TaxID=401638 RepID=UPI001B7FC1D9|nr:hypothetical protein [Paenibacillus taiwanensis]
MSKGTQIGHVDKHIQSTVISSANNICESIDKTFCGSILISIHNEMDDGRPKVSFNRPLVSQHRVAINQVG